MGSGTASRNGLEWKLRRIARGLRQMDVAVRIGITTTRLSQIERSEQQPSKLERQLLDRVLPPLERGGFSTET